MTSFHARDDGAPILRYFEYSHLPPGAMMDTSRAFHALAERVVSTLPASAERTVALRKLLEGKDAAVRAAMDLTDTEGTTP